jgi:tetratricopeptide (TPR) repeat protein
MERQARASLGPGASQALVSRAVAACDRGDYEAAIADLTAALGASARDPDLLYNRGFALEAAGRREEAISDYTRALLIAEADRAELLYRRGRCHLALGRTDDAICDLKAHLAIGNSPHEKEIGDLLGIQPYQTADQGAPPQASTIS